MRRDHDGLALPGECLAQIQDIERVLDIEVRRRLVQQNKFRFDDQTSCDKDALTFPYRIAW